MTRSSSHAVSLVVVLMASTAACVQTATQLCGDGTMCRSNTGCHSLGEPERFVCVSEPQVTACNGVLDGMECTVDSELGTCVDGACFPARCGDSIKDVSEACDDGGRESGGGCSANCQSLELCGDGLTDLSLGEQCDEGVVGLSGDGCSSKCLNEYDLWRDVTPGLPLQRYDQAFVAEPTGGILMFGGTAGMGAIGEDSFPLGDTWRWDGVTWSQLAPPTGAPTRRARSAAAYDSGRQRTLIFGGRDAAGAYLDELWEWNGVGWTKATPTGSKPGKRAGASLACSTTNCLLFGGESDGVALTDSWSWDGAAWMQITSSGPPARHGAALVFDTMRARYVLVGGRNLQVDYQDYWEFSTSWAQAGTLPTSYAFSKPIAAFDETTATMVVINGSQTYTYNSVWTMTARPFIGSNPKLTTAKSSGRAVALSSTQSMVAEWYNTNWNLKEVFRPLGNPRGIAATYDPVRGQTIIVDAGSSTQPTATWEWNGAVWKRTAVLATQAHPPAAEGSALVFDSKCGEAVLFGGAGSPSSVHGETWIYKGTWTPYSGSGPAPRSHHAMAYDTVRDAVVLFGGHGPQPLSDLWEWRGPCGSKQWTRVMATGPSSRGGARMAYDERRMVTVLFGGAGTAADQTWEWDGAVWREIASTLTTPSARSDHGMAYDPRLKAVVVYGGRAGALRHEDGARWNGAVWLPIEAVISVAGRSAMAMAPDVTGGLMMIGGENALVPLSEIFRLRSVTVDEPLERCHLADADLDGDGLRGCADPDCGARCRPLCPLGVSCAGPHCGDGVCSVIEDYLLCPADCPAP